MRTIAIVVVALHVILLLEPAACSSPTCSTTSATRGSAALHHLNPYTHVIGRRSTTRSTSFTTWHNLRSPYGPLFTALSYPLGVAAAPGRLLDR